MNEEIKEANERKNNIMKQYNSLVKSHAKEIRIHNKDLNNLKNEADALKLKLAELNTEGRIFQLKLKQKERKLNMRHKLKPINHTPAPRKTGKIDHNYNELVKGKFSNNRRSVNNLKGVDTGSDQVYSSLDVDGASMKEIKL